MFETLEKLLNQVQINDDTDYYQLYSIIELLDVVVGAEILLPREKVSFQNTVNTSTIMVKDVGTLDFMLFFFEKSSIPPFLPFNVVLVFTFFF